MDRAEFAKRLKSIIIPEGTSSEMLRSLTRPISDAISQMMPDSLFRFRKYNNDSIDAFKNDIIYAVTADKFNDPYDTLARYDIEEIKNAMSSIMNCDALEQLKEWFKQGNDFPEHIKESLPTGMAEAIKTKLISLDSVKTIENRILEIKEQMISSIETLFPVLAETSKRFITIACFCESVLPVLMWSHYADSHQGFALEYNFRPTLEHPMNHVGLFPVIYENERADVSSYIAWEYLFTIGMKAPNPDISASLKNALYKASIWAYEKEWRMIDFSPRDFTNNMPSAIPYEPVAIYYGKHMSFEHKQMLHEIAQEKGIKEFEMYVDYSSPLFEMQYRPVFT